MTDADLQRRLIYSVLVAGKTAKFAESKLAGLLGTEGWVAPFDFIRAADEDGMLDWELRQAGTGRYGLLAQCFARLVDVDPRTCLISDLEAIPGIGPKTARFFILWTRPGVRHAALDVHVLRWLRDQGYDAPKATPPAGKRYRQLEEAFLAEAEQRGLSPRELDSDIWDAAQEKETRDA